MPDAEIINNLEEIGAWLGSIATNTQPGSRRRHELIRWMEALLEAQKKLKEAEHGN